jgi:hypothetical protein
MDLCSTERLGVRAGREIARAVGENVRRTA